MKQNTKTQSVDDRNINYEQLNTKQQSNLFSGIVFTVERHCWLFGI